MNKRINNEGFKYIHPQYTFTQQVITQQGVH